MDSPKPSRRRRLRAAERLEATSDSHLRSPEGAPNVVDIADYIAKMSAELAKLASAARLDTLTYLLNMARIEAESHVPKFSVPPS